MNTGELPGWAPEHARHLYSRPGALWVPYFYQLRPGLSQHDVHLGPIRLQAYLTGDTPGSEDAGLILRDDIECQVFLVKCKYVAHDRACRHCRDLVWDVAQGEGPSEAGYCFAGAGDWDGLPLTYALNSVDYDADRWVRRADPGNRSTPVQARSQTAARRTTAQGAAWVPPSVSEPLRGPR